MPLMHLNPGGNGKAPDLTLLTGQRFREAVIRTLDAQAQAYGLLQDRFDAMKEFMADLAGSVEGLRMQLKTALDQLDAIDRAKEKV